MPSDTKSPEADMLDELLETLEEDLPSSKPREPKTENADDDPIIITSSSEPEEDEGDHTPQVELDNDVAMTDAPALCDESLCAIPAGWIGFDTIMSGC